MRDNLQTGEPYNAKYKEQHARTLVTEEQLSKFLSTSEQKVKLAFEPRCHLDGAFIHIPVT